jgi:hypothetical protein
MDERVLLISQAPGMLRAVAAAAAASRSDCGSPASSAVSRRTMNWSVSSFSTFWPKFVYSPASRWLIWDRRALAVASSRAPARTKLV